MWWLTTAGRTTSKHWVSHKLEAGPSSTILHVGAFSGDVHLPPCEQEYIGSQIAKLSLNNSAARGSETNICSIFPRNCFLVSKTPALLEAKAQWHRTGEYATCTSPQPRHSRTAGSAHLSFTSGWTESGGQEPLWDWQQAAAQEGWNSYGLTLIFSWITGLAAAPQRTVLKQLNSKYSYLTYLK